MFRVWVEEGQGREKILGAKVYKREVRVEPVILDEEVVVEVKG